MNLHPYDGTNRRYHHTDIQRDDGLGIVSKLLRLTTETVPVDTFYDLSFYSGGMGIIDRLAITVSIDLNMWVDLVGTLSAKTPEEASEDPDWHEDFLWLITDEEELVVPRFASMQFINSKRHPFQAECHLTSHIFFENDSNVNDWIALWGDDYQLNYLCYSQG
jgi:hypothetical protein